MKMREEMSGIFRKERGEGLYMDGELREGWTSTLGLP